jgi:hypothetical protein
VRAVPGGAWRVGAFADLAYSIDSGFPDNHVWRGQARTARVGSFALNLVAAYLMHEPRKSAPFRFEVALQAGSDVESNYAGEPNGTAIGPEAFKHVGLANAGIVGPWGWKKGYTTETGAGVFQSPISIGGFWSKDNWNYSPAWGNSATPFYLMGAHVAQRFADKVELRAWVVNGWQIIGDNNSAPSYLGSLSAEPIAGLILGQHVYFGPEHAELGVDAWRWHSDTQILFERERWGIGAFGDYGQEKRTDLLDQPVHRWAGGGIVSRLRVHAFRHADWDMALRPEAWWDESGAIFGKPQLLTSISYTNSLDLFKHALVRIEYRYDRSTAQGGYFYVEDRILDSDRLAQDHHLLFLSVVGYFERAFGGGERKRNRAQESAG